MKCFLQSGRKVGRCGGRQCGRQGKGGGWEEAACQCAWHEGELQRWHGKAWGSVKCTARPPAHSAPAQKRAVWGHATVPAHARRVQTPRWSKPSTMPPGAIPFREPAVREGRGSVSTFWQVFFVYGKNHMKSIGDKELL